MVTDRDGSAIIVGGTGGTHGYSNPQIWLLILYHAGPNTQCFGMYQTLKTPRLWHSAFLIPDEATDCK